MKRTLKVLGAIALLALLAAGYAAYRIVWGHPFTINQLAGRQAFFFLTRNPELFTSVGIVDGRGAHSRVGRSYTACMAGSIISKETSAFDATVNSPSCFDLPNTSW